MEAREASIRGGSCLPAPIAIAPGARIRAWHVMSKTMLPALGNPPKLLSTTPVAPGGLHQYIPAKFRPASRLSGEGPYSHQEISPMAQQISEIKAAARARSG